MSESYTPLPPERVDRFWAKAVQQPSGCWEWSGSVSPYGYGILVIRRRPTRAHRVAYELKYGRIPQGLVIDHLCRNTKCVNPAHLEAVTNTVNVLRGIGPSARNAVATQCVHGHDLADDNVVIVPGGKRQCIECGRRRTRDYQRRKRVRATISSLCRMCKKRPQDGGFKSCALCRARKIAMKRSKKPSVDRRRKR
jgi:hypothetical protein